MNTDNTRGAAEPSLASAGSHGDGMVARLRSWRDERGYPTPGEMLDEAADEIERLRLTDAERTFLRMVRDTYAMQDDDEVCGMIAASISGLLERMR